MSITIEDANNGQTVMVVQTELGEKHLILSEDADGMLRWAINETCHKCDQHDCYGYPLIGGTLGESKSFSVTDTLEVVARLSDAAMFGEFVDYDLPVDFVYSEELVA